MSTLLSSIFEWYTRLPESVQAAHLVAGGAIITSLIACLGVMAGLRINRTKNRIDTDMALRQEVCFQACECVIDLTDALGRETAGGVSSEYDSASKAFAVVCDKLRLIGTAELVALTCELQNEFASNHREGIRLSRSIEAIKSKVAESTANLLSLARKLDQQHRGKPESAAIEAAWADEAFDSQRKALIAHFQSEFVSLMNLATPIIQSREEAKAKFILAMRNSLNITLEGPDGANVFLTTVKRSSEKRLEWSRRDLEEHLRRFTAPFESLEALLRLAEHNKNALELSRNTENRRM